MPLTAAFVVLLSLPAQAGTQDFRLVNQMGEDIWALHISESTNDDWEEDVLGENILPNGDSKLILFSDRNACLWDIKTVHDDGNDEVHEHIVNSINLCKASVVVMRCDDDDECWAEFE
jgi:hypothetical protein